LNSTGHRPALAEEQDNSRPLFMTDNPKYAAEYVLNGGKVLSIEIPRSTLFQMQMNGVLNISPQPQYHINGLSGIEYRFAPEIKSVIVPRFK